MAPEYGKPIHQLPLVPATVLKKHRVHAPLDTRVRSAARLLQAFWREDRDLPIGSYVNEDGKRRKTRQPYLRSGGPGRRQFPHIQNRPYRPARAAYREVGVLVDAEQFATNLLSSMPLAFNLLAPWGHSLERASTYPIELLPAFTGSAQEGLQQPVSKVMPCPPVRDRVLSLTCAGGAAPDSCAIYVFSRGFRLKTNDQLSDHRQWESDCTQCFWWHTAGRKHCSAGFIGTRNETLHDI